MLPVSRIILLLVIAIATPVFAEPSPDEVARAHYVAAQSYYKQGRAAEALREFEEAYRIAPRPAFHYNIAICHEKLGDDGLAIIAYQRYLAESPNADDRAAVQEHVALLRARAMPPAAAAPAPAAPVPGAEPTPARCVAGADRHCAGARARDAAVEARLVLGRGRRRSRAGDHGGGGGRGRRRRRQQLAADAAGSDAAMRWALLCLAAAGCGSASNPCAGQPGICLAVEVRGNVPKLDVLDLAVTILPSRTLTGQTSNLPGAITLPVQFAVLLPSDVSTAALQIEVVGARGGVPSAYGVATANVPPSGQRVKIELVALQPDGGTVDFSRFPAGSTDFAMPPFGTDLSVPPGRDLATPGCVPTSCSKLGVTCGSPSDGCGKTLTCGPACQLGGFSSAGALNPGLTAFAFAQTNSSVYLFGGQDANQNAVATVQRAPINADGTLGAFTNAGISISSARVSSFAASTSGFVYVTGGGTVDPLLGTLTGGNTVDGAAINPDGTLGAFTNNGTPLTTARDSHVAITVKNFLYVIGGEDINGTPLASVERAPINANGSIGAFSAFSSLSIPRTGPTAILTSNFLYVIGGGGAGTAIFTSIERATVGSDGTLGAFSDAGIDLQTSRFGATTTMIGNDVYEVGGETIPGDAGPGVFLTTVEHATVSGGTLSGFNLMSGVTLATGRDGHGAAVTGNSLFIIGGFNGTAALPSIERGLLQ